MTNNFIESNSNSKNYRLTVDNFCFQGLWSSIRIGISHGIVLLNAKKNVMSVSSVSHISK